MLPYLLSKSKVLKSESQKAQYYYKMITINYLKHNY